MEEGYIVHQKWRFPLVVLEGAGKGFALGEKGLVVVEAFGTADLALGEKGLVVVEAFGTVDFASGSANLGVVEAFDTGRLRYSPDSVTCFIIQENQL